MKKFLVLIVLIGIAGGSWLYLSHSISETKPRVVQPSPATDSTSAVEKDCFCCAKRLARLKTQIQQQRQERKRQAQAKQAKDTADRVKRFLTSRSEPVAPKSNP